jgi:hypothetical protein
MNWLSRSSIQAVALHQSRPPDATTVEFHIAALACRIEEITPRHTSRERSVIGVRVVPRGREPLSVVRAALFSWLSQGQSSPPDSRSSDV